MGLTAGNENRLKDKMVKLREDYNGYISSELETYRDRLSGIRRVAKHLPDPVPKIETIPRIFNRVHDENFISDYLAYILDPAKNGVGKDPLLALLDFRNEHIDEGEMSSVSLLGEEEITVEREYTFEGGGRIDILVKCEDSFVIGIENKISSGEGTKQTAGYARAVKKEFPDYETVLLYLTRTGSKPSSKKFVAISYAELLSVLNNVRLGGFTDLRKLAIYQDFLTHIKEYIMKKGELKITELTKLYIENYHDLIAKLEESYDNDTSIYFDFILDSVREVLTEGDWVLNLKSGRNYQEFYKESWRDKGIAIRYLLWFDADWLLFRDSVQLMVDAERNDKELYFSHFDKEYDKLTAQYEKYNISYRPSNRKIAIAFKKYKLHKELHLMKPKEISDFFERIIEEFNFLNEPIDRVLAKLRKTK